MLARAGYALAGTLVAVLVAWLMSLVVPSSHPGFLELFAFAAAMGATLMVWAAFKPSRGPSRAVAVEALVVFVTMMCVQMGSDFLRSPSMLGYSPGPLLWVWNYTMFMLYSGLGLVLPAAWALGSNERWLRRSPKLVVGELAFVLVSWALAANGMLDFSSTLLGFAIQGLVFVAAALAAAAVFQRAVCEIVWRSRGERADEPATPRHAPAACPDPAPRQPLRTACIIVLVASAGLSALALAFFFVCAAYARAHGLEVRNVVYDVPTFCVLATCFVAIPFSAIGAAAGPSKDYRVAGYAVLCALVLLPTMLFSTARLDVPEETVQDDGTVKVVTPVWLDRDRVSYATPEGPLFMRMLPDAPAASVPEDEEPLPREQSGYSYHTTGTIASIDAAAQTLELAVTDSTEYLATGEHVTVECAAAEHFDVPFDELAVGETVQIRSTEACADGVIVAQKVFVEISDYYRPEGGPERSLDDILASYDCPYAITGTVISAVGENGFEFRIDDGGGAIENGTELYVSTLFVERRLYGMKGLQWGMDGVIIGFSALPSEDVLRAKVIVGNDDTSSAYWENMQIAN